MTNKNRPSFRGRVLNGKLQLEISEKELMEVFVEGFSDGTELEISVGKAENRRTTTQNNSIYLYCRQVAEALSREGQTLNQVLGKMKKGVELPMTKELVLETIWRPIMEALLEKRSTTEMNKEQDISIVWEACNKFLSRFGISVPFPSLETMEIKE